MRLSRSSGEIRLSRSSDGNETCYGYIYVEMRIRLEFLWREVKIRVTMKPGGHDCHYREMWT